MIDTIVMKVAAPCNLRCTYCYEYQSGDNTWQSMPKHSQPKIAYQLGLRIREYAESCRVRDFNVNFHGGEPLLLGRQKLQSLVDALREGAGPIKLRLGMQTNAVLINQNIVEFFKQNHFKVGISLDGNEAHNKERLSLKGRPTFKETVSGFELVQNLAPQCLSGILAVINIENDPAETVEYLCSLRPKQLDLLLPFETHDSLGANRDTWANKLDHWLSGAFDTWYHNKEFAKVKVRIFEDTMQACITRRPLTDWFGPREVSYLIVSTNGEIDTLDHLKVIGADSIKYRATSNNLFNNTLQQAETAALEMLYKAQATSAPSGCKECKFLDVCAGGYLPHRYSSEAEFNNPSVACTAIKGMFEKSISIMS